MYPLSKDASTTLSFLIGKEICQVCIGSYDVQFHWGDGGISVWSKFIFRAAGTTEGTTWAGKEPESATPVVRLLKATITSFDITGRGSLLLTFSNMDQLEIFEDEGYESFSIRDGKAPIIIV